MSSTFHLPRSLTALGVMTTMALGTSACGSSSTHSSATQKTSASAEVKSAAPQKSTSTMSTSLTTSSRAESQNAAGSPTSSSNGGNGAMTTGVQSKITFALPAGFKVFDSAALQNDAKLAELSRITGVPAQSLRLPGNAMDLNAVSLHKENGGTSNILLFAADPQSGVPDEATAKELISQTGSTYVGYHTAQTSLGQAALVESRDATASGGSITHEDIYLPQHDGVGAQLTVNAVSQQRARQLASIVASTVKAAQ